MKKLIGLAGVLIFCLTLAPGCKPAASDEGREPMKPTGAWKVLVDIDQARVGVGGEIQASGFGSVNGHPIEVRNSPVGCTWQPPTTPTMDVGPAKPGTSGILTCEIMFRNLDETACMRNVRTRLVNSTNPSAIMTMVDYLWPGPVVNPNTAQPIDNSGYCITESSPDSSGSSEGCENTWQDNIPPFAIATQRFIFTNVDAGQYTFYLQVFADYYACSEPPMYMSRIPAGCFDMGDPYSAVYHNVCLTSDFFMDRYEVTNGEYQDCVDAEACTTIPGYLDVSGDREPYFANPTYSSYPVVNVTWDQAAAYCAWMGKRLPTEAEWEYAGRGGLHQALFPWGNSVSGADENYYDSGDAEDNNTNMGGSYDPNGYGLYDMGGNVLEWVNDWFDASYYSVSPVDDPPGPDTGTDRVVRGGCWYWYDYDMYVGIRTAIVPVANTDYMGFRCAQNAD